MLEGNFDAFCINSRVKLKHFEKFADITEALSATTASIEGKISKSLKKLIKKHVVDEHEKLLVADSKLGNLCLPKLETWVLIS